MSEFIKVARMSDLRHGRMKQVMVDGEKVMLARLGDTVYALNNLCTHAHGWLHLGKLHPETCEVQCPLHEGRFDLRTGEATHEPCVEPVEAYNVRIEGDDILVGPPKA